MNPSPFQTCCAFVIDIEGRDKITNLKSDPGGLTKYGISQRAHPHLDIANLTLPQAENVYEVAYWNLVGCSGLPLPLAMIVFDAAVNQGHDAAARMLQYTLMVKADGVIGPKTLAAANRGSVRAHVQEYAARRMHRYATTRGWDENGLGWSRRLMACLTYALQLGEPH